MPSHSPLTNKANVLARWREPDDPELLDARRAAAAARLEEHVRKVVDAAPPLTDEQRERIAAVLRPAHLVDSGRRASA